MSQQASGFERAPLSRRRLLGAALSSAAAATLAGRVAQAAEQPKTQDEQKPTKPGRLRHSIAWWCFAPYWSPEEMVSVAKKLGCGSIELIAPEHFPLLKKHGLECAIASIDMGPDPPFVKGFNNPQHHAQVLAATRKAIDACAEHGFKNVIAFTGMRENISDEDGARHCVKGFKQVVGYAEKKSVTLCLEMLNTRDDTHPMKGHPGYQGNHTEYCVDIIRKVGSPSLKLLFDVYHVQIMDDDVIRRIRQYHDLIGHVHTAGNPGRGELNDQQEIAYRPIMQALADAGYRGYVGHEFIPTGDPLTGLKQAIEVCAV